MNDLNDILKALCLSNGISGREENIRDIIIDLISDHCEYKTDNLGNIIAFKKGKNKALKKVMCDAHTDEVGFIITDITSDGFLKFASVGGIDASVIPASKVTVGENNTPGVIGIKPVHLTDKSELKTSPKESSLYIDIGAKNKEEAQKAVKIGDSAVIPGDFIKSGDYILSKAIDDRVGCAVLIKMLQTPADYDFYASFSVQEEVGLRGAAVSAYEINPDFAVVLDATTASDIPGSSPETQVCNLGRGAVVSFMDKATLYDKELYYAALNSNIKCQPKRAVAGGNNSGRIHLSRGGIRTIALSLPCRYIHSPSSVGNTNDINSLFELSKYMVSLCASGNI